ncbi:MAG: hypothetical protein RCG15_02630 [Candidatus Rickettsia vulgarisii]
MKEVLLSQTANPNTKIIVENTRQVIENRERSKSLSKTNNDLG